MKNGKWRICCILAAAALAAAILPAAANRIRKETLTQEAPICTAVPHDHEALCYRENGELCCGYGDFSVHIHEELCYYGNGNLRCSLPQITAHTHTDSCYEPVETAFGEVLLWKQVLTCREPELRLHSHTLDCFRDGTWICGQLEIRKHSHSQECFFQKATKADARTGIGEETITPFTLAGLIHAAAAAGLLYLQKKWKKIVSY